MKSTAGDREAEAALLSLKRTLKSIMKRQESNFRSDFNAIKGSDVIAASSSVFLCHRYGLYCLSLVRARRTTAPASKYRPNRTASEPHPATEEHNCVTFFRLYATQTLERSQKQHDRNSVM